MLHRLKVATDHATRPKDVDAQMEEVLAPACPPPLEPFTPCLPPAPPVPLR